MCAGICGDNIGADAGEKRIIVIMGTCTDI